MNLLPFIQAVVSECLRNLLTSVSSAAAAYKRHATEPGELLGVRRRHWKGRLDADPAVSCSRADDLEKGQALNTNYQGFLGRRFLPDGH